MPKEQNIPLADYLSQIATESTRDASQLLEEASLALKSGELTDSQKKTEAASNAQADVISINTLIGIVDAKIGDIKREISRRNIRITEGYTIDVVLRPEVSIQSQNVIQKELKNVNDVFIPIEELNLSVRAYNALKGQGGLLTVGQILAQSDDELLSIRNFGKRSLNELIEKLTERRFRR